MANAAAEQGPDRPRTPLTPAADRHQGICTERGQASGGALSRRQLWTCQMSRVRHAGAFNLSSSGAASTPWPSIRCYALTRLPLLCITIESSSRSSDDRLRWRIGVGETEGRGLGSESPMRARLGGVPPRSMSYVRCTGAKPCDQG